MWASEAAHQVGLPTHVLRYWEREGLVSPPRAGNGYRDYDDETLLRLRVVKNCREAGLSVELIRHVLKQHEDGRAGLIRAELARLNEELTKLVTTRQFLEHVLTCRHSLMTRCDGCRGFGNT